MGEKVGLFRTHGALWEEDIKPYACELNSDQINLVPYQYKMHFFQHPNFMGKFKEPKEHLIGGN
jgi:hypothetical protein